VTVARPSRQAFEELPDLASRALGAAVVWANDEFFAAKENLINPSPAVFTPATFTHRGQEYDGWETRRRRPGAPGTAGTTHDSAVIRLGSPGIVRGVVVDTAFFRGNYPPRCSIDAAWADGYPSPDELAAAPWTEIVPPHPLDGDTAHRIPVGVDGDDRRFSHVRLNMLPDGGIARLRVHADPVPDPDLLDGLTVNLAALRDGARVSACSDMFYNRADKMLMPGEPADMGDGWENARRRDGGNDWVELALTAQGVIDVLDIDTTHYKGNAPHTAKVSAACLAPGTTLRPTDWFELLPPTRLQPDTPHRYPLRDPRPATHLRLDVYPDGGIARLRAWGSATPDALSALRLRWKQTGATATSRAP
jgi:allantoicase